jgi:hypothetical protein
MLSRLVELAAAQRRASALGMDVPELLGRRDELLTSDEGLSRRDLLKKAALAGAAMTVAGRAVLDPAKAFGAGPSSQPRIAA